MNMQIKYISGYSFLYASFYRFPDFSELHSLCFAEKEAMIFAQKGFFLALIE